MKLIRITDDRFIVDLGPDATARKAEEVRRIWKEWWEAGNTEPPSILTVGGGEERLDYLDRRDPGAEYLDILGAAIAKAKQAIRITEILIVVDIVVIIGLVVWQVFR